MRRFAFELKMQDKSAYLLAADSESEMEEWISTLNKILHSSFELAMQEKRNGDLHDGLCVCLSEYVGFQYWTTQTTTTPDMTADNKETHPAPLLTSAQNHTSLLFRVVRYPRHLDSVCVFWFIFAQWSTCIIWSD